MPDEQGDVGQFECRKDERLHPIGRLLTAQLSPSENAPSPRFHLRFVLACGTGDLTGADARYEVHLRQCLVELEADNCCVDLSDAYSFELPSEILEEIFEGSERRIASSEIGGGLDGKVGLGQRLSGSFKLRRKKTAEDKQQRKAKGKRRILLISCNGHYWTVGDDEYGDPRRHNGWLYERYFNEDPKKPLCAVSVTECASQATITITVRAKYGHLDVFRLDERGRPLRRAGTEYAHDIANALRARLAGMALAKEISNRQRVELEKLPPAEFELARNIVVAHMPKPATSAPVKCKSGVTTAIPLAPIGQSKHGDNEI